MTITDNHFAGPASEDRVGRGEVRFVAIPEPSTLLLGGLALFGLVRQKRQAEPKTFLFHPPYLRLG